MPRIVLENKLARALSALGGRNLFKTGEILAGNLALLMDGQAKSDAKHSTVTVNKQELQVNPVPGKPVFKGKYYAFQKGDVVLQGPQALLDKALPALSQMARDRKLYLLSRRDKLEDYGLDEEFVLKMHEKVKALEVKK
jgi:hypothetical protein